MDQAGNESPPSNIVVVAHDGNMQTEREWAELGWWARSESGVKAMSALQGEWIGTKDNGPSVSMVFRGDGFNLIQGTSIIAGAIRVRTHPNDDLVGLSFESHKLGGMVLGISEVKGDSLRMCLAKPGAPRPTRFATTSDGSATLYTLTRKNDK
jgi:hypothetical protein